MTKESINEIHALCTHVEKTIATHHAMANTQGEQFNIFAILRMQRNEAETHSRFIYELLSPEGSHGEGYAFLQIFLHHVAGSALNAETFTVKREDPTEHNRRIDLTLSSAEALIGIELKIDAQDQRQQLFDYDKELRKRAKPGQRVKLCYLTLNGKAASKNSLKTLNEQDYQRLSFKHDIRKWLMECIQHCTSKTPLREAISQYLRLIELMTGWNPSMCQDIAKNLLETPERFEAAIEISKALKAAKAQLQCRFWTQLHAKIHQRFNVDACIHGGQSFKEISSRYYSAKKSNKHIGFSFPISTSTQYPDLCIDINLYHSVHYGIRAQSSQGGFITLPKIQRHTLREKSGQGNAVADKRMDWINSFYYPPTGTYRRPINFGSFEGLILNMTDPLTMEAVINEIVEHLAQLAEQLSATA